MKLIYWIKSRLSMKCVDTLFLDKVNGLYVRLYVDCYGKHWMAQTKYGFRTER